jgi:hypothetical protein
MPDIVFTTRLTEADWDDTIRGWRCPVLGVPGAVVDALYLEGGRVDPARYEVLAGQAFIRWILADRPERAAVVIKLTQELTLGTETDRWKRLAIVLPVVATIVAAAISGAATYFSRAPATHMTPDIQRPGFSARSPVSEPPATRLPSRATTTGAVDAIGRDNTTFGNALPIALGTTYLSRFRNDDSSLYFSFNQGADAHDLQVELTLLAADAQVRPRLAIYDGQRNRLFSRWHESKDGNTMIWQVPLTAGDYFIEVKPDYTQGDFAQFLLTVAASRS